MLERHANLMLDLAWRVLDDTYFSTPEGRALYVPFLNAHSELILPGTDFLGRCCTNRHWPARCPRMPPTISPTRCQRPGRNNPRAALRNS